MKTTLLPALLSLFPFVYAASAARSFVVLSGCAGPESLIRISAEGKVLTKVADNIDGADMTVDAAGNYIIAARSKLLRVTKSGIVTTIAKAPEDAVWVAVAVSPRGDFVVADAKKHVLWRISADGKLIDPPFEYPGSDALHSLRVGLLADESGFLLLREGDDGIPNLFRIGFDGAVTRKPLSGAVVKFNSLEKPNAPTAHSGGRMVSDGQGGSFFLDHGTTRNIFHITNEGSVTKIAFVGDTAIHPTALARVAETGDLIVGDWGQIFRVSADGTKVDKLREHLWCNTEAVLVEQDGVR